MRKTFSRWAVVVIAFGSGCAVDAADDTPGGGDSVATREQAVGAKLDACFVNQGQPDPSVPLSRRFDSSCSTPTPGSFIFFRTWDFGDGTGITTGGTQTDHTFPFTNTCYKVHLTVFDANGKDDDVFHYVTFCTVSPCNPICPP